VEREAQLHEALASEAPPPFKRDTERSAPNPARSAPDTQRSAPNPGRSANGRSAS